MIPVELYTAAGARGGERVRTLLALTGRPVSTRDLFDQPPSWDDPKHMAGMADGVQRLLSRQVAGYRDRAFVSEIELLNLMVADPTLLRRPIVVVGGVVLVGFEGHGLDRDRPASAG